MSVKVGINGFGRIGRLVFRAMCERGDEFEIVGVNDLADTDMMAHLLKYDSTQGRFPGTVEIKSEDALIVNGKEVAMITERDPAALPWAKLEADIVVGDDLVAQVRREGGGEALLEGFRELSGQEIPGRSGTITVWAR